ncbi:MAG: TetR family transcriptional regulator [Actinomycetota bacterium]
MSDQPSRQTRAQTERRIRVLETAMRMAGDGGYDAVQMRAVAEESGVALGTIYRYYSGKDELLIAGLAGWLGRTRRRVQAGTLHGETPGERLIWLLERSAERTEQRPTLMGALITALGTTSPTAAEYKLDIDAEMRAIVVTALGPDSGYDADGVARVIGHVWSSALTRWVSGMAPTGSVGAELVHAARMLVGVPSRV